MKLLPLNRGKFAQVPDDAYDRVIQAGEEYRWYVRKHRNTFYAQRSIPHPNKPGKMTAQSLHQFLLPGVKQIDHADGDGLNNQWDNLRPATDTQNSANRKKLTNTTSRFKGVCWHKGIRSWIAQIKIHQYHLHLGSYESEEDAAHVYDYAAKIYFGEFARVNFP